MKYKKINLKDVTSLNTEATLEFYQIEVNTDGVVEKKPTLLILPGGGYHYCSDREAEPVAFRFASEGFNCFVLRYTTMTKYPAPQLDVVAAMDYIKNHYEEYDLMDKDISLVGFSAGGHLAASVGAYYKELAEQLSINIDNARPFALILGYAVISNTISNTHQRTFEIMTGGDEKMLDKMSIEKHITKDFPPTYIFTTKTDTVVNPENSQILYETLKKANIPTQFDLFETGIHGGSIYSYRVYDAYIRDNPEVRKNAIWVNSATDFIFNLIYKK